VPDAPSASFLTQKAGPLPVYAWAGGILGVALLIARFRTAKQDTGTPQPSAASTYASTPEGTVPQFLIQNMYPWAPSAPVTSPVTAPPVITPPGTATVPPMSGGPAGTRPVPGPPITSPTTPPAAGAAGASPQWYTVQHNDTLSAIAARYGTTADKIWQYNTTPGNRNAEAIATLRSRGPNLIYAGTKFLIPPN
jgi:LysM repeat protein